MWVGNDVGNNEQLKFFLKMFVLKVIDLAITFIGWIMSQRKTNER